MLSRASTLDHLRITLTAQLSGAEGDPDGFSGF